MGDWRDSDRSQMNEETGAVVDLEWGQLFNYRYRCSGEKFARLLDAGQLMGDPIYSATRLGGRRWLENASDFC